MIRIVIIEDDFLTSDFLIQLLGKASMPLQVKAVLRTVEESVEFLEAHLDETDLILSDIQLKDGVAFSIFEQVEITCPIIFISSYDQYLISTFEFNGIDYLVKPVSEEKLAKALEKYTQLANHFYKPKLNAGALLSEYVVNKKTKLLVRKGTLQVLLSFDEIVFFYTENMVVYVLDRTGNKYLADKSLHELEKELDPKVFFRVNRQYMININYLESFRIYERVKLIVKLRTQFEHMIVVGQERSRAFKRWVRQA
jgi:DNA-binding LytR/AlgR family response regulator